MNTHNITIEGGTSKRLLTAGKYCDRDIVVTATGGGEGSGNIESIFSVVKEIRLSDLDIFDKEHLIVESETLSSLSKFTSLANNTKVKKITFDIPESQNLYYAFQGQDLIEEIEFVNGVSAKYSTSAFCDCENLKTITGKLSLTGTDENLSQVFYNCKELVDVSFERNTIQSNISFNESSKLSTKTMMSVLQGLVDLNGKESKRLTLNDDHYAYMQAYQESVLAAITAKNWIITNELQGE